MEKVRIIISGIWIALMLTYLLGDVLRIFAGHAEPGKIDGKEASQWMWFLIAIIMLIPILMIILTLTVYYPYIRWINIVMTIFVFLFNIIGLPYKGAYDNFLIGVSLLMNLLILWYAWQWKVQ